MTSRGNASRKTMPTTDKLNPDSKSQAAELRHDPSFEPTTAKVKSTTSRKSKFRIFLFAALLLAIAAVTATCFFRLDYPYLSTEDAYVHGNQIFLTPRVTGTVVAINADDTDLVQKGQPLVVLDGGPTYLPYRAFRYANFTFGFSTAMLAGIAFLGGGSVIFGYTPGVLTYTVFDAGLV